MSQIIYFVFGIIIGAGVGFWWARKKDSSPRRGGTQNDKEGDQNDNKEGLIERQAEEKQANKEKILAYLADRQEVSNDDIENLLAVSNATAERYLDELEKEGRLLQVGKTGRSVYYRKA